MAFFYLKPINWLWGWTHIIYVPAVWYYFPTATACRVSSQRSTKFTMYRYLLLLCSGIAFSANSMFSDSNLFDDNMPSSLNPTAEDDFGTNLWLDDDSFSTSNLIGGGYHTFELLPSLARWNADSRFLSSKLTPMVIPILTRRQRIQSLTSPLTKIGWATSTILSKMKPVSENLLLLTRTAYRISMTKHPTLLLLTLPQINVSWARRPPWTNYEIEATRAKIFSTQARKSSSLILET